jgi:pimeloyl-ACP methyl ester carboxylesterase
MRNVILLHGAWHGAWCWTPITARLAARGIPSVAVDLEGHGLLARSPEARWTRPFDPAAFATEPSPLASITASSAAELLIEQIRTIGGGEPCVVVAHSMGGVVATAAAERAPELFDHLVYVAAMAPVSGRPTAGYFALPENATSRMAPIFAADPSVVGALRVDGGDRSVHPHLRDAFCNGIDPATADAAIALLTTDFPMGIAAEVLPMTSSRYGVVPHSYVLCERDHSIPADLQRLLIREIDAASAAPTKVFELDAPHSPFLSHPDELAEAIASVW